LGIASLEDKIVQPAVVTILNQIYEVDFRGFSYGFRPGRDPHQALDALNVGIARRRVNWILDADIKGFFDHVSHEWREKFLEHRIADTRVLRLIQKWMKAGVLEDGERSETEQGTPQGAVVSPLLAKFGLEVHPDKTRLIAFGREAWRNRKREGQGKLETFTFLGFTHYCGENSKGYFQVWRETAGKRMRAKLQQIKQELRARAFPLAAGSTVAVCLTPSESEVAGDLEGDWPSPRPVNSCAAHLASVPECTL